MLRFFSNIRWMEENPAPVDYWFIQLFIGFQTSKVVQDVHPQDGGFQAIGGYPNRWMI